MNKKQTHKKNIVAIIPARMGSSRFPGKPMANIIGMPMIGHVYSRVSLCQSLSAVYVATCDTEIKTYIESIGGNAIMTSDKHERCSDRYAEAMLKIETQLNEKIDIVVMVQGDEPLTHPNMIDQALAPMLENADINIVNLAGKMTDISEFEDPNEVKLVVDNNMDAIYFQENQSHLEKKDMILYQC